MLTDQLSNMKSCFADGVNTILRGQENRSRMVMLVQGNLVSNVRSASRGINALVEKNGVTGFSSMAEYSEEAAKKVLEAATRNAMFLNKHITKEKAMLPSPCSGIILPKRDVLDMEQQRIIDACREVDAYVVKNCPNITSRSIRYSEDSMDKVLYSSSACDGHVTYPRCYIYVTLEAETKDGVPVSLFKATGGVGSFSDNFSDLSKVFAAADEIYRNLMDKREGVYAKAGNHTVILGGMMAGMLAHEAVGHTVEADLVVGGSVSGPLLNKRVGSDLVNLTDFAYEAFGEEVPLPVWMDDEGVRAEDAPLIRDGILVGYMNNRETADRFGMKPAGNARAWDYFDEPLIRMRNTCIHPGTSTLEEMIANTEEGYYLIDSGNGQADLTGEFMFGATMGYEIKNGKLGKALLDTTVSGIAFEMLKTVDMISDHVTWSSSGFCGKKQRMPAAMGGPEIRCKINIGGR